MTGPGWSPGGLSAVYEAVYGALPPHPLHDLPKPEGDPTALRVGQRAYDPAGREFGQTVPSGLRGAAGEVVGSAWIGKAGASCEAAVDGLAAVSNRTGGNADSAAAALGACANRWEAALAQYEQAEWWASQALSEEARHREQAARQAEQLESRGQAAQAAEARAQAEGYRAEAERSKARQLAGEAIQSFDQASNQLVHELRAGAESIGVFTQAFGHAGSPMLALLPTIAGLTPEQLKQVETAQRAARMMSDGRYTPAELARLEQLLGRNTNASVFASTLLGALGPMGLMAFLSGLPKGSQGLQRALRSVVTGGGAAGLSAREYREALNAYWTGIALKEAGIDISQWNPAAGAAANREIIHKVYRYYGDLYLNHPYMRWAGMANMIGPSFAAGFFDIGKFRQFAGKLSSLPPGVLAGLPPEVRAALPELAQLSESEARFYETTLLQMQKEIFFDQAPMHEAYLHGGMDALREMHRAGIIDDKTLWAWHNIDRGRLTDNEELIAQGNEYLLYREQYEIVANDYDKMRNHLPSGPAFTYALTFAGKPSIPGAHGFADEFPLTVATETPGPERLGYPDDLGPIPLPGEGVTVDNPAQGTVIVETPLPDGDISKRDARWELIQQDTLPAYRELITDQPQRAREIIAKPVPERIDNYRMDERIDDILRQLADWDVRFRQ